MSRFQTGSKTTFQRKAVPFIGLLIYSLLFVNEQAVSSSPVPSLDGLDDHYRQVSDSPFPKNIRTAKSFETVEMNTNERDLYNPVMPIVNIGQSHKHIKIVLSYRDQKDRKKRKYQTLSSPSSFPNGNQEDPNLEEIITDKRAQGKKKKKMSTRKKHRKEHTRETSDVRDLNDASISSQSFPPNILPHSSKTRIGTLIDNAISDTQKQISHQWKYPQHLWHSSQIPDNENHVAEDKSTHENSPLDAQLPPSTSHPNTNFEGSEPFHFTEEKSYWRPNTVQNQHQEKDEKFEDIFFTLPIFKKHVPGSMTRKSYDFNDEFIAASDIFEHEMLRATSWGHYYYIIHQTINNLEHFFDKYQIKEQELKPLLNRHVRKLNHVLEGNNMQIQNEFLHSKNYSVTREMILKGVNEWCIAKKNHLNLFSKIGQKNLLDTDSKKDEPLDNDDEQSLQLTKDDFEFFLNENELENDIPIDNHDIHLNESDFVVGKNMNPNQPLNDELEGDVETEAEYQQYKEVLEEFQNLINPIVSVHLMYLDMYIDFEGYSKMVDFERFTIANDIRIMSEESQKFNEKVHGNRITRYTSIINLIVKPLIAVGEELTLLVKGESPYTFKQKSMILKKLMELMKPIKKVIEHL